MLHVMFFFLFFFSSMTHVLVLKTLELIEEVLGCLSLHF